MLQELRTDSAVEHSRPDWAPTGERPQGPPAGGVVSGGLRKHEATGWGRCMLTVRRGTTIVVEVCFCCQARRKTPLAVVWVSAGMLAATSTMY